MRVYALSFLNQRRFVEKYGDVKVKVKCTQCKKRTKKIGKRKRQRLGLCDCANLQKLLELAEDNFYSVMKLLKLINNRQNSVLNLSQLSENTIRENLLNSSNLNDVTKS